MRQAYFEVGEQESLRWSQDRMGSALVFCQPGQLQSASRVCLKWEFFPFQNAFHAEFRLFENDYQKQCQGRQISDSIINKYLLSAEYL